MRKRSRFSLWRFAAAAAAAALFIFLCGKLYTIYEYQQQIAEAEATRQELLREKSDLEARKKELQDPAVIERKARDDLGMVKPGEVPYVR